MSGQVYKVGKLHTGEPVLGYLDRMSALLDMVANISGDGRHISVSYDGIGVQIEMTEQTQNAIMEATPVKTFRVDSSTAVDESQDKNDNPTQWRYRITQMLKTGVGYEKWGTDPFGIASDSEEENELWGYNWLEDRNTIIAKGQKLDPFDTDTRFQNGVVHDNDYPDTWKMQPLLNESMHPGIIIDAPTVDFDGAPTAVPEVWLMPYSGEDGTCA